MSFAKNISSIAPAQFGPFAQGIMQAQLMLPLAGRFVVNQNVMDAVDRIAQNSFEELLPLLSKATLPFPITWIEWSGPNGIGHLGYLCEQLANGGFAFRQFGSVKTAEQKFGFPLVCMQGRIRIETTGWTAESPGDQHGTGTRPNYLEAAARDILRLLLILNSPSKVLVIEVPDNAARNALRARRGQAPVLDVRSIKFDIARFQEAARAEVCLQTEREIAEHVVKGHFKIRATGLF